MCDSIIITHYSKIHVQLTCKMFLNIAILHMCRKTINKSLTLFKTFKYN